MKFVSVDSARGLKIEEPVFTKNENGEYGLGRMIKEEKTTAGVTRTFEVATFAENGHPPSINPTTVTNITHVAIIRNEKKVDEAVAE